MAIRYWYRAEADAAAAAHQLDPALVVAVSLTESSGHTYAYRYEPQFWARYLEHSPMYAGAVPMRVAASYGLMQVMYPTARAHGFPATDPPEYLFVPEVGLDYGCRVLAGVLSWAKGDVLAALAAYNGGKTKDNGPGVTPKRNQAYVDKVLTWLGTVRNGGVTG